MFHYKCNLPFRMLAVYFILKMTSTKKGAFKIQTFMPKAEVCKGQRPLCGSFGNGNLINGAVGSTGI